MRRILEQGRVPLFIEKIAVSKFVVWCREIAGQGWGAFRSSPYVRREGSVHSNHPELGRGGASCPDTNI